MAKVQFKRYLTNQEAEQSNIIDGQLIVTKEGNIYTDYDDERIPLIDTVAGDWQTPTLNNEFVQYANSAYSRVKYKKIGAIVEIQGAVKPAQQIPKAISDLDELHTIFTLPEGFRPEYDVIELRQGSGAHVWLCRIQSNGNVTFSRLRNGTEFIDANTTEWLPLHIVFSAK